MPLAAEHPLVRGDLFITVRNTTTGVVQRISIRNTIVFNGLTSLVQLLSQKSTYPAPTTLSIQGLRVGTGTTPPVRGDINLVTPVYTLALTDANKNDTTSGTTYETRLVATLPNGLDTDPYNNVTLSEAGIILGTNTLFARQIHPGIVKNTSIVIDYDWRIGFTS